MIRRYSRPRNLNGGLCQPFPSLRHKLQRLYDHALAAGRRQFLPPLDSFLLIRFVGEIHNSEWCREQQIGISVADSSQRLHVPNVVIRRVHARLAGE